MATLDTLASTDVVRTRSMAPVRWWLFAVAALVVVMVSVGGATRLTGSGLSITEWKPIMGAIPPLSDADWHEAFEKYRQIPQYRQVKQGHVPGGLQVHILVGVGASLLARLVGVAFLVPFLVFLSLGYIRRSLVPRMVGCSPLAACRASSAGTWWLGSLRARLGEPVPAGAASRAGLRHPRCSCLDRADTRGRG